jgi:hypothetical protein
MIAAGMNAEALSSYMGHSTITVTLDRYGHLLPQRTRSRRAARPMPRPSRLQSVTAAISPGSLGSERRDPVVQPVFKTGQAW